MKKVYPINLIKMTTIENKNKKQKQKQKQKQKLHVFKIQKESFIYNTDIIIRTLHLFPSWDNSKRARRRPGEGANHTLLTVGFITYQHHSLL